MKRVLDIVVSMLGLVMLAPVILTVAVFVRCRLGAPILFRQQRPGLVGRPFELIKFRTMTDAHAADGRLLPDAERLTPFGKLLRSSSIDELPTLLNVLRGEMSLVGPRPLLMQYLPLYNEFQVRRHEVRPGITGWAQVNGRNELSWEEKFNHDVYYVDNQSLYFDLKIIWMTLHKVLRRDGISASGEATMPTFRGDSAN